jgi:hypothetical protein
MNSSEPDKLQRVVQLLSANRAEIDAFMEAYIFKPCRIDIKNCLIKQNLIAARTLSLENGPDIM